jgi:hypothetical protein
MPANASRLATLPSVSLELAYSSHASFTSSNVSLTTSATSPPTSAALSTLGTAFTLTAGVCSPTIGAEGASSTMGAASASSTLEMRAASSAPIASSPSPA